MLDVSRSMAEPAKFDMARRIAAALCYIGLAHLDQADDPRRSAAGSAHESSPGRGKGRIFRVFELLEGSKQAGRPICVSRSRSSRRGRGRWG